MPLILNPKPAKLRFKLSFRATSHIERRSNGPVSSIAWGTVQTPFGEPQRDVVVVHKGWKLAKRERLLEYFEVQKDLYDEGFLPEQILDICGRMPSEVQDDISRLNKAGFCEISSLLELPTYAHFKTFQIPVSYNGRDGTPECDMIAGSMKFLSGGPEKFASTWGFSQVWKCCWDYYFENPVRVGVFSGMDERYPPMTKGANAEFIVRATNPKSVSAMVQPMSTHVLVSMKADDEESATAQPMSNHHFIFMDSDIKRCYGLVWILTRGLRPHNVSGWHGRGDLT